MTESINDCWRTPQWLYDELNEAYGPFDIDLCSNKTNNKCYWYYQDYLNHIRANNEFDNTGQHAPCSLGYYPHDNKEVVCFMNPPYSNAKPFIQKAWDDSKYCKIVCLIKCDPSTSMWQIFYDFQIGKPKPGCDIKLINKRIQFDPPPEMGALLIKGKWHINCNKCKGKGKYNFKSPYSSWLDEDGMKCEICKGTGKTKLSGPSFPSCILVFDRRNL